MSLEEVRESFFFPTQPSDEIIEKIKSLIQIIPKEIAEQKQFLHLLNIISNENENSWLSKFEEIVKSNWKPENEKIFASVIIRQNLYYDIYVKMIKILDEKTRNNIIDTIINYKLNNSEEQNVGTFMGKYCISLNFETVDVENILDFDLENKAGIVIAMFLIFMKSGRKELIPEHIFDKIRHYDLQTKTLMNLYDLEDIYIS
jgi:hypothetical protein